MAIVKVVMHLKWRTLNAYAISLILDFELASKINGILINGLFFSVART